MEAHDMDEKYPPFTIARILFYALAFVSPLLLTTVNYELFEFNKMLFVYLVTVLIGTSIVVEFVRIKRIYVPATPLDIPIFLWLLSQLVSTFLSIDPHLSLFGYYGRFNGGLLSSICYIILYYSFIIAFYEELSNFAEKVSFKLKSLLLFFRLGNKSEDPLPLPTPVGFNSKALLYLAYAGISSAVLVSLYAIAQKFGIDAHLWVQDVQNRVFSTMGQPNWLAAYLVVITSITSTLVLIYKRTGLFLILPPLIFYSAFLLTKSRSGFLAFWICNALLFIITTFKHGVICREKRWYIWPFSANQDINKRLRYFFILNILFVLLTIVIESPISIPSISSPSVITNQPTGGTALEDVSFNTQVTDSGDIRKIVWTGAWEAALARPYFGWGVETFAWIYYRFKPVEHNLTSEWDFLYNKAHNEYLNYAATSGFIGLGTYLLIIAVYLWWLIRLTVKQPINSKNTLIISIGIAWISILITNFFGFSVVVTSLLFWLLPSLSFLLAKSASNSHYLLKLTKLQSRIATAIVCVFGLYLSFSVATYWLADYYYAKGVAASAQDEYQDSYEMLSSAISLRPEEPAYLNEMSETLSVLAYAYDEQNDATISAELSEQAIHATNKALEISPLNVSFWKGRTRVFYNLSQINPIYLDQALQSIETAQALAPTDPKVAYNRAILLNNTGKKDEAFAALEQAIKMKPNYRDAAYALAIFYEEDENMEKRNEWLNYILENINPEDSEVKEKLESN